MSAVTNPAITDVFELLDKWRHFPAYKLEPRVDPFFALFLLEVLGAHFDVEMHHVVIPEFPLRRGTLFGENSRGPNKSKKVDYAAFTKDRTTLFLVELKTDSNSRNPGQDHYLEKAKKVKLSALVEGIICIYQRTDKQQKYDHLLACLSELGFIDRDGSRVQNAVDGDGPDIQIVYVQPTSNPPCKNIIDFECFAKLVEDRGETGKLFAKYLRKWIIPAGTESGGN